MHSVKHEAALVQPLFNKIFSSILHLANEICTKNLENLNILRPMWYKFFFNPLNYDRVIKEPTFWDLGSTKEGWGKLQNNLK